MSSLTQLMCRCSSSAQIQPEHNMSMLQARGHSQDAEMCKAGSSKQHTSSHIMNLTSAVLYQ